MTTLRVAMLDVATVKLMESFAGSWVSILGLCRKLFRILDLIFEPLAMDNPKTVLRLSDEMKSEMLALVIVGTFAAYNLRACFLDRVYSTDASKEWMAGVVAPCLTIRKGVWTKLLTPI